MNSRVRRLRFIRPVQVLGTGLLMGAIAMIALGGSISVKAQDTGTPPSGTGTPTPSTIYVSGQGRIKIDPDTALVTVGVDILKPTLAEAQTEATTQMTAIIDAVEAAGVAEDDIKTVNFSVNIIRDYDENGNPAEVQGFQISNQVEITIRDTDRLGELLDQAVGQGANNIYGISFFVEDTSAAASQAREQAVRDATTKATELATAAGMTVSRVMSISESYAPPPTPVDYDMAGAADMARSEAAPVPVQTGTFEVMVDVQMTFEIV